MRLKNYNYCMCKFDTSVSAHVRMQVAIAGCTCKVVTTDLTLILNGLSSVSAHMRM